jgi:type 1 glutamine amidotransferase
VERAWNWPTEAQFATANVIVAFSYLPWTDAHKQQVRQFLDRGAGWVTIHAATWTKPKADPAIADLIGVGGFTKFRHGLLNVDLIAPQHPICGGLPQRLVFQDEPYWPPTPDIDPHRVTVLAVSMEKTHEDRLAPQPLFWTYESGRGRAFGCVPGHFTWTFDDPWFRLLLLRGIAWAAGESPGRLDTLALRGARVRE